MSALYQYQIYEMLATKGHPCNMCPVFYFKSAMRTHRRLEITTAKPSNSGMIRLADPCGTAASFPRSTSLLGCKSPIGSIGTSMDQGKLSHETITLSTIGLMRLKPPVILMNQSKVSIRICHLAKAHPTIHC